jgi:hypothetical protein
MPPLCTKGTDMTRPFRFAVQAGYSTSRADWVDLARRVEDLGYSALHVADHYLGPGTMIERTGNRVQMMACLPAMTAAAMATSTLRIGSRMACVSYHLPAILASEMATIDVLSDGRLEIGLGAGWLAEEYEALGIQLEPPQRRIQLLRETVEFMKMAYGSEEEVDYQGEYVRAHGYVATPRPIQRPGPPLMIGGGAPKVLGLAGELADIVSLKFDKGAAAGGAGGTPASIEVETRKKIAWIMNGAGDRFDQIELETAMYFVSIDGVSEITSGDVIAKAGMSREQLSASPHGAVGSVDEVCEQLLRRREEYGFSYITVGSAHVEAFAPIVSRLSGT